MADLRHLLAIYVHAHQTGNSVPPHIDAEARTALAAEPVDGLSPKEIEAQEGFTQMRDEVLGGVEGLYSHQINIVLNIIDDYTPECV
jgi:hypothetical protein